MSELNDLMIRYEMWLKPRECSDGLGVWEAYAFHGSSKFNGYSFGNTPLEAARACAKNHETVVIARGEYEKLKAMGCAMTIKAYEIIT